MTKHGLYCRVSTSPTAERKLLRSLRSLGSRGWSSGSISSGRIRVSKNPVCGNCTIGRRRGKRIGRSMLVFGMRPYNDMARERERVGRWWMLFYVLLDRVRSKYPSCLLDLEHFEKRCIPKILSSMTYLSLYLSISRSASERKKGTCRTQPNQTNTNKSQA